MKTCFKAYAKYLKTITHLKFDPIVLFITIQFTNGVKETFSLYLLLLLVFHLPIIILKNQLKK